ncbi:MAG: type II toxin-antitoxin system RelE/ParE family toxin [Tannerellaceae bacterium]|jgi:plasmid stabilization system protein ParE|nr:type II toxin-antitoxin system RelE/ParE family toxin [Tannerellaceae bacterium]
MGEGIPCKPVEVSDDFYANRKQIYHYTLETFGQSQAKRYQEQISESLELLNKSYLSFPECRYLATKKRIYRNIVLASHLIIYRITGVRIEVLDIIHAASSVRRIKGVRKIHI